VNISPKPPQGRPPATSHAAIETAAFALFAARGFEDTTVEDIAHAVGIGRRTLFRYFSSKNDILWGQFDSSLENLGRSLRQPPDNLPVFDAVHRAIVAFNRLDAEAIPQHRQRMTLILRTPALQAHSVLRYEQWRAVIADYAAERYGLDRDSLLPRTIGHVSLALALTAYEQWLETEDTFLEDLLNASVSTLHGYVPATLHP